MPLLAALLALTAGAAQVWLLGDLKQLPSAVFGGDYTYQMGCIRSILASGNPMASCSCSGALPGYLPLYGTLVALAVQLTGASILKTMLLMSAFNHAASALIVCFVIGRHFGRPAGLALACVWATLYSPPVLKYTEFTAQVLVPLYFDALLLFVKAPRPGRALYLGLTLAALGYSHAVAFSGGLVIAVISSLIGIARRARAGGVGRELIATARGLAIVVPCVALSLGYWYRPIFVHHGRTSLHYAEWNGGVLMRTLSERLSYAGSVLRAFVHNDEAPRTVLHVLLFAGLAALIWARPRRLYAPAVLIAAVTFAWMFHYFLSMPLMHTHFVPEYVRSMLWSFAILLVAAIPISLLFERVRRRAVSRALMAAMVGGAAAVLLVQTGARAQDQAIAYARNPLPAQYAALQAWVYARTRPDDVVLSTNELSFAWSALTGRKTLVTRRAQNDPFLDMDERNRDAALILYGHDDVKRRTLLARWRVRYVLWTTDWTDSEYPKDAAGNELVGDPLLYFPNSSYDEELLDAGVRVHGAYTWVDPAMRWPDVPKFDLTLILPENYEKRSRPWRTGLDPLLEQVWSYARGDSVVAAVYRVRNPSVGRR